MAARPGADIAGSGARNSIVNCHAQVNCSSKGSAPRPDMLGYPTHNDLGETWHEFREQVFGAAHSSGGHRQSGLTHEIAVEADRARLDGTGGKAGIRGLEPGAVGVAGDRRTVGSVASDVRSFHGGTGCYPAAQ